MYTLWSDAIQAITGRQGRGVEEQTEAPGDYIHAPLSGKSCLFGGAAPLSWPPHGLGWPLRS
jgi:hypothetical protein